MKSTNCLHVKKLIDKLKEAKQAGWAKFSLDGEKMVVMTQVELDSLLKQSKDQ